MKKITYNIERDLEKTHWWFNGRRRLLKVLLSHLNIQMDSPVIDVGCGVGSNLLLLQSIGLKVIGIDSEPYSLSFAKNLSGILLINGDVLKLPVKSNSIDLVIATDILEHLDDDSLGIREIHRTLTREGKVILTVPAFKSLWGIQDVVGMHKRRYSKNELLKKIEREGFTVVKSSYFNFFLFFPILLGRRLIRLFGLKIESENNINSPLINFVLKGLFSFEPYILKYFSFPFGVSVFCIARKS
jgi:SAM-dependent methyltransferase